MPPALVWAVASFLVGVAVGVVPMVAAFASRVAVLEERDKQLEKNDGRIESQLETIRRDINGIGEAVRALAAQRQAA